jgi:putative SOS response-associated peptidase YedK
MCAGVSYRAEGKTRKVYFSHASAQLPVKVRDPVQSVVSLPWGRRQWEEGQLPATGWARLESIKSGKWDRYRLRSVKIPVDQFMEKDRDGEAHWFVVDAGRFIQGALARWRDEARVYVVTVAPTGGQAIIHDRWPRIVGAERLAETRRVSA